MGGGRFSCRYRGLPLRLAAVAAGFACLTAGAAPRRPVTLQMAYISEADDGLTRQSVAALARPDAVPKLAPPSEYSIEVAPDMDAPRTRVTMHRHRHRAQKEAAARAEVAAQPSSGKPRRPWMMVKLVAFTTWWNGWSERNLHTKALDVHLDRPAKQEA